MSELYDNGRSVEELSLMGEGTLPPGVGLAKQVVQGGDFIVCAPIIVHSSSTPLEVFLKLIF